MRKLFQFAIPIALFVCLWIYMNTHDPVRDHYEWKKQQQLERGYLP